jgi:hypothetical protein
LIAAHRRRCHASSPRELAPVGRIMVIDPAFRGVGLELSGSSRTWRTGTSSDRRHPTSGGRDRRLTLRFGVSSPDTRHPAERHEQAGLLVRLARPLDCRESGAEGRVWTSAISFPTGRALVAVSSLRSRREISKPSRRLRPIGARRSRP